MTTKNKVDLEQLVYDLKRSRDRLGKIAKDNPCDHECGQCCCIEANAASVIEQAINALQSKPTPQAQGVGALDDLIFKTHEEINLKNGGKPYVKAGDISQIIHHLNTTGQLREGEEEVHEFDMEEALNKAERLQE